MTCTADKLVVKPALGNVNRSAGYSVNKPVFTCNPARPVSYQLMPQQFRFAQAGKWMQERISNQPVNALADPFIGLAPIFQVLQGL